jgi:hypothetical protein
VLRGQPVPSTKFVLFKKVVNSQKNSRCCSIINNFQQSLAEAAARKHTRYGHLL